MYFTQNPDFDVFPKKTLSQLPDFMVEGKNAPCTEPQRRYMYWLMNEVGFSTNELQEAIGIYVPVSDFTIAEAGAAIDFLKNIKDCNNFSGGNDLW